MAGTASLKSTIFSFLNPLINRELNLTRGGLVGNLMSAANDFGLNRKVLQTAQGEAEQHIDVLFGRVIGAAGAGGKKYFHPVFEAGKSEARVAVVNSIEESVEGWKAYYADPNNKGFMTGVGRRIFNMFGEGGQKMYAKIGGASQAIGPLALAYFTLGGIREGYREGGILGGLGGGIRSLGEQLVTNKLIGTAMRHPLLTLGAGALMYGSFRFTYGMFDVRTRGANYQRMGRTAGLSWANGGTIGMESQMASTIRGRALMAMENSRFNAMRSLGSESYMMTAPKARYANSTAIYGTAPMLSY